MFPRFRRNSPTYYLINKLFSTDFEWATRLNRILLNAVGIWPSAHNSVSDKMLSNLKATVALTSMVIVGLIPEIHYMINTKSDMITTADSLQYLLPLMIAIMKHVIIWWRRTGRSCDKQIYVTFVCFFSIFIAIAITIYNKIIFFIYIKISRRS